MKRKLFISAWILALLLPLRALANETKMLVVGFVDGSVIQLALSDTPHVSFPGDNIHVESALLSADYPRYRVVDMHFEGAVDMGILTPKDGNRSPLSIDYRQSGELVIRGDIGSHAVRVYNTSGALIKTIIPSDKSCIRISTAGFGKGVYVVNIQDITSFKIHVR